MENPKVRQKNHEKKVAQQDLIKSNIFLAIHTYLLYINLLIHF